MPFRRVRPPPRAPYECSQSPVQECLGDVHDQTGLQAVAGQVQHEAVSRIYRDSNTLMTHTPLIKGVEVHPLDYWGGLSKATCFIVFFEAPPP